MSWTPLVPRQVQSGNRKLSTAVALSGIASKWPKTCLVLRPGLLEAARWISLGRRITVLTGSDEHAGMLRVQPDSDGAYRLAKAGGRANIGTLMVFLPWLHGVKPVQQAPVSVVYRCTDKWLDVTLPAWARPPAPNVAGAVPAVVPARAGYTGVTARMPDPAADDRVRTRRAGGL